MSLGRDAGDMKDLNRQAEVVENAARRGARSATRVRQVIEDAVDQTLSRMVDAVLRDREVRDWAAWAYRVGANAARSACSPHRRGSVSAETIPGDLASEEPNPRARPTADELRSRIQAGASRLIGRQLEVALKLVEPGMTLHRAARELGMDRTSLRRSFASALNRLKALEQSTPPHLFGVGDHLEFGRVHASHAGHPNLETVANFLRPEEIHDSHVCVVRVRLRHSARAPS